MFSFERFCQSATQYVTKILNTEKKEMQKKIIALMLFIAMAFISMVSCQNTEVSEEPEMKTDAYLAYGIGTISDFPIVEGTGTAGQRIKTSTPIHSFSFDFWEFTPPVEATVSIFSWKGNYENTVSSEAVISFKRDKGGKQEFKLEESLPAGEYLFLIHDTKGVLGLRRYGSNESSKGYS